MGIKVRAALEVIGFIVAIILVISGIQNLATLIINTYGVETALNAASFCFASVAAYVAVSLLYDIRVAKLQYKAKLEEMTKK